MQEKQPELNEEVVEQTVEKFNKKPTPAEKAARYQDEQRTIYQAMHDRAHKRQALIELVGEKTRPGLMRNKPCVCGSGKKFKKCCIGEYA